MCNCELTSKTCCAAHDHSSVTLDDGSADLVGVRAEAGPKIQQHGSRSSSPVIEADDSFSEHVGTNIGPYKLLERIGEGGFGVVFVAEQPSRCGERWH